MKKRRILLISLTLVLVLTALTPATALAHQGKQPTESFSGSGLIYVTYMPEPIIKGNTWHYNGEIVEGLLDQCDWDLLAGTVFWSEHDSVVRVGDDGSAKGVMKGTFTLTRPDGTGTLKGKFSGKIIGNLFTGDISDAGTWESTRGTGVFEGVKAQGKWSADLTYNGVTLIGPVTWEGKYTNPVKPQEINKPGKPDKPIKPGKPIKPWKPIKPGKP